MFNFFKSDERPTDIKGIRHALLQFIKSELQKAEGGEGSYIKGLCLFMSSDEAEKHTYEAAVYLDEEDRFKSEIQKIADDYDLGLPKDWTLEYIFENSFPPEAVQAPNLDAALFIRTNKHFIQHSATAYLRVLNGQAEKEEYTLASGSQKFNIGRDRKAQGDDGFFRTNHIAFPSDAAHPSNKYISRQHAHIEWDNEAGNFVLYADEGGVPPRNKIKIRSAEGDEPIKLHSTAIGHRLAEGDQIVLGESAALEFSYQPENA